MADDLCDRDFGMQGLQNVNSIADTDDQIATEAAQLALQDCQAFLQERALTSGCVGQCPIVRLEDIKRHNGAPLCRVGKRGMVIEA